MARDQTIGYGAYGATRGIAESEDSAAYVNYIGWAGGKGIKFDTGKAKLTTYSLREKFNLFVDNIR